MYIIQLGIYIEVLDASSRAEIGIYSAEQGVVKDLIYSNLLSLNTRGYRFTPAAVALAPGLYFFAYNSESSTAELRMSRPSIMLLGHSNPDHYTPNTCYIESNTFSNGMPSSAGDISLSSARVPRILARIK